MVSVTFLLIGSVLCLYNGLGDASFSQISNIATSIVERNLPARVQSSLLGNGARQYRVKREVVTKKLDDPKACIEQCQKNETIGIMTATVKNVARLVALALEDIKGDETDTPEKEAAFKKRIEDKTIANMGPLFADLCTVTQQAEDCFKVCPESQLRNLVFMDHLNTIEVLCEPGTKTWSNFTEYWNAINCTNTTESEKPCENKCGVEKEIKNVTSLSIGDEADELDFDAITESDDSKSESKSASKSDSGDFNLKYETDSKKNTAAVGPVCKTTLCTIDCYKPIMTEKCGAKAFDLYSRTRKLEPRMSLHLLKMLDAVETTPECKTFQ